MAVPSLGFSLSPTIAIIFVFLILSLLPLIVHVNSQTCKTQKFANNGFYDDCLDLPALASYLHYKHDKSNSSIDVVFVAPPSRAGGWIAWGINPGSDGMVGAQSFIAHQGNDGKVIVKTYSIDSYSAVVASKLSFEVWDLSAEASDGVLRIFAKMKVPANSSSLNFVWQVGPSVTKGIPDQHEFQAANLRAKGTLSLTGSPGGTTGSTVAPIDNSRTKKRNIHGILNGVSWGILFPLGAMIARYVRTFEAADPAWFYAHISCQVSGYAIGVAGWATGLKLGSETKGFTYSTHRNIGIALFAIATLQIFALFLRPKKEHKVRFYWNIYHHGLGYAIIVLGVLNVFKGLDILNPAKVWKSLYLIAILVLGGVSLLLEAITWIVVLRRRSSATTKPFAGAGDSPSSPHHRPISI